MLDDNNHLNDIYAELAKIIGFENMVKVYHAYGGQQISYPKKLMRTEYIKKCVKQEYTGSNAKELAVKYGYTERWIRKIINQIHE